MMTFSRAITLLLTVMLTTAAVKSEEPNSAPNILLILVDDLRTELGCYGIEEVHTLNIDQFAETALLFERAYCQMAVCRSSRLSFLSGLRPDERRIWANEDVRPSMQDIEFLPAHFRNHDYHTLGFGKIAHGGEEDPRCWSEPHQVPENRLYEYRTRAGRALVKKVKHEAAEAGRPDPFRDLPEKIHRGMPWEILNFPGRDTGDEQLADMALAALERVKEKQFFLAAGFLRPHLPFVAPRQYWELYDEDNLPPPGLVSARPRNFLSVKVVSDFC